jgi:hypothetical protein
MDTSELQKQIYLDGRRRYEEKTGIHPDAPVCAGPASRVAQLQRVIDQCKAKFPEADITTESTQPAEPAPEVDPQMRLAKKWAQELRLARAGAAARQAHGGGPFEASAHKLEPYTTYS